MEIYTKTSLAFIKRLKTYAKDILEGEMGLKFSRSRVHFHWGSTPLGFVVFEHPSILGHFRAHGYQIGLNKKLMYLSKTTVIKNILRHELAHFYAYVKHKDAIQSHGTEYRDICRSFGWDKDVFSAKLDLEIANEKLEGDLKSEKIISKVKKLLNLASSSNQHEAQLATLKANQLMIQHNLQHTKLIDDEEEVCLKAVITGKRRNAKHECIYEILKTFLVRPIFNYGAGEFYIEVIGPRLNVTLAEYVAHFLDNALEKMWDQAKKENAKLKGVSAKNSFMLAVAKGYETKQRPMQAGEKDLVILEKNLDRMFNVVYPSTRSTGSSQRKESSLAKALGLKAGRSLSISPGLKNSNKKTKLLR